MIRKILVIIGSLERGGTEKHLLETLPLLDREKYSIEIFTLTYPGELAAALRQRHINVYSYLNEQAHWRQANKLMRLYYVLRASHHLIQHMRSSQADILHFYLPMSYLVGSICAMLAGPRCRIMSRRSMNHYQHKRPLLRKVEHWLHKHLTLATGNSKAVIENLIEEGIPSDRLRLMYNGIQLPTQNADTGSIRKELGIANESLIFICVANLIAYKGHLDLLQALAQVKHKLPERWDLLCVGYDGGIQNSLEQLAVHLDIQPHIHFIGAKADVYPYFYASDIGVLCSHEEGFSNSILEGMAAKLPLIVTDVGGNAEAVIDGHTGIVVQPRNVQAIAAAITRLSQDKPLRKLMGRHGYERVKEYFSMQQSVTAYETLYEEALAKYCEYAENRYRSGRAQ